MFTLPRYYDSQRQATVAAYFKSEQLLLLTLCWGQEIHTYWQLGAVKAPHSCAYMYTHRVHRSAAQPGTTQLTVSNRCRSGWPSLDHRCEVLVHASEIGAGKEDAIGQEKDAGSTTGQHLPMLARRWAAVFSCPMATGSQDALLIGWYGFYLV